MMPSNSTAAINSEVAIGRRMKMLEKLMAPGLRRTSSTAPSASAARHRGGLDLRGGRRCRHFARFHRRDLGALLQPELARGDDLVTGLQATGDDQAVVAGFTPGDHRLHRDVLRGLVVGGTLLFAARPTPGLFVSARLGIRFVLFRTRRR